MTPLLADRLILRAPRDRIWQILRSPDRLARVLPGCQELHVAGSDTFHGTFETRVQFLTLRAQTTARLLDVQPPDRLRLALEGRPLGLAGAFVVSVPIALHEDDGTTTIDYAIDLETTGRLATFGAPLLRETARRQVQELVRNLERELDRDQAEVG
jgi:carbon monoxide dehydrogenase subunit G